MKINPDETGPEVPIEDLVRYAVEDEGAMSDGELGGWFGGQLDTDGVRLSLTYQKHGNTFAEHNEGEHEGVEYADTERTFIELEHAVEVVGQALATNTADTFEVWRERVRRWLLDVD